MKLTKSYLRKLIKEEILKEALPPHLQKHFRKDGSSVYEPQIKDVTPAGYGPEPSIEDKIKSEFPAATISVANDGEIIVVVNDEDLLVALQQDPDTQRFMTDEFGDWAATNNGFVISPGGSY